MSAGQPDRESKRYSGKNLFGCRYVTFEREGTQEIMYVPDEQFFKGLPQEFDARSEDEVIRSLDRTIENLHNEAKRKRFNTEPGY